MNELRCRRLRQQWVRQARQARHQWSQDLHEHSDRVFACPARSGGSPVLYLNRSHRWQVVPHAKTILTQPFDSSVLAVFLDSSVSNVSAGLRHQKPQPQGSGNTQPLAAAQGTSMAQESSIKVRRDFMCHPLQGVFLP